MYLKKSLFLIFVLILFLSNLNAETTNRLDFDAIKTKAIDVDINVEYPIVIKSYAEGDSLIFKTPIPFNSRNQKVETETYYFNKIGEKIKGEIEEDEFGNSIAIFNIENIELNKYVFYINSNVKSENKIILNNDVFDLTEDINDFIDYKLPSRNIQSDKSEIISLVNMIKQSNNSLEEVVNITNWVHQNIDYDLEYANSVEDSLTVLSNRAGVCDEFANLAAALLRARGFPVRYVSGYANSTLNWETHAWLEVYIPGQDWISVDPTYGEVGFVDASHIVISRSYDLTDVKDQIIGSSTLKPLFGEKINNFKINSQKNYADSGYLNVLNVNLISEKKYKQDSAFTITVKVKNTNINPLTNLFILRTNNDFVQIYPKYSEVIIYLEPMQEKELVYYYILPKNTNPMSYPYILATQFTDYESHVNVYPNEGIYEEAFFVLDPIFYFKENNLFIDQDIINHTKNNKELILDFNVNGSLLNQKILIEPQKIYNLNKEFNSFLEGTFSYKISGDYDFYKSFQFYADEIIFDQNDTNVSKEDNLIVDNNKVIVDSNFWKDLENKNIQNKEVYINKHIIYILSILFLIGIILILLLKKKKKGI